MIVYLATGLSIAVFGPLLNNKNKKLFLLFSILILVVVSACRGGFTSDYNSYTGFYSTVGNYYSFSDIWTRHFYQEKGFVFLNKFLYQFFPDPRFIIVFMSVVTILLFLFVISKHSKTTWLAILLFVSIGNFYDSFNVSRQIMAAAIVFSGYDFLKNKQFFRYSLVVLIAFLMHRTAILMIPIYFLLNLKISVKNTTFLIVCGIASVFLLPIIINFVQRYLFVEYQDYKYGMSGGSWKWLVVPISFLVFFLFSLFAKRTRGFDLNSDGNNVLVNALILYVVFSILGMSVSMVTRLSTFVQPFSWLLMVKIIDSYKDKHERYAVVSVVTILCLMYPLITLSGTGYDPYYFFWE